MDLPIITMEPEDARRAFEAYRAEVRIRRGEQEYRRQSLLARISEADREARERVAAEDEALMAGYRLIASGKPVISLAATIGAGGYDAAGYPRVAIARADQVHVEVRFSGDDASFEPVMWGQRAASKFFTVPMPHWEPPAPGAFRERMVADVPRVPAWLRPAGDLSRYATLFEASWRRPAVNRRRIGDPALLRPLGGDLYAVVAVWDLTPLERAVLGIAEPEA